jgi:hypothetical protein
MSTTTADAPPALPTVESTPGTVASFLRDRAELRAVVKEPMVEVLQGQRGLLAEIVIQAVEDIALARAIDEGRDTEIVPIEEIYEILDAAQCES